VLRLELLDLGLMPLHLHHRLGLLGGERERRQHHAERQEDDVEPEVGNDAVEEREDRADRVGDRIEDAGQDHRVAFHRARRTRAPERTFGGGTGSKPPPCQGWHRPTRPIANQVPRAAPWTSSASSAYSEHDGENRQRGARYRLTSRQARTGCWRTLAGRVLPVGS